MYYLIITQTITYKPNPIPSCTFQINYEWMNIADCVFLWIFSGVIHYDFEIDKNLTQNNNGSNDMASLYEQ